MAKTTALNPDDCVKERYSAASQQREASLCCPVVYDPRFLEAIPEEILERDYGCGDPSPFVRPGDTVVDLGSGGGKLCYIISQQVGPAGKVIGVDFNRDMLDLARQHQAAVAAKIGHDNVEFRCGRIQDLAIDLEQLAEELATKTVRSPEEALEVLQLSDQIRQGRPMIADQTVDCVVSNCVLNLVRPEDRQQLFREIFRVLKPGGIAAISDIVSDEDVPAAMQQDGGLWSGCISGAWREDRFVDEFAQAGFAGIRIEKRQSEAWQTVNGIEFRSLTVVATRPLESVCLERNQALIYRGPFSEIQTDDGKFFPRGKPIAVCDRTFRAFQEGVYEDQFLAVAPRVEVPLSEATEFDCDAPSRLRPVRETKGGTAGLTIQGDGCCGGGSDGGCC